MRIQRMISAGITLGLFAAASTSALATWMPWPNTDFEWYAKVGTPASGLTRDDAMPAHREGYIYSPGHWERRADGGYDKVAGHWIKDDYFEQLAAAVAESNAKMAAAGNTTVASGPSRNTR